jgi:hypothetical protein
MVQYTDSYLQNNSEIVLCIEERDDERNYRFIDTRLFVFWDELTNDFVIAGKRDGAQYIPYVFHCADTDSVLSFIKLTIGNRKCSMVYYNYNNLFQQQDITYEYFEQNMNETYEIVAYDNIEINYKKLKTTLRAIKNIYGYNN